MGKQLITGLLKKENVSDPLIHLIPAHSMKETYPHGFHTQWKEIGGTVTSHPGPNSTVLAYLLTIPGNAANRLINPTAEDQEIPTQSNPNPWVNVTSRKMKRSDSVSESAAP